MPKHPSQTVEKLKISMSRKGLGNDNSSLCTAKQALPAAPSWAVSGFPNGIRKRNLVPLRKSPDFKDLQSKSCTKKSGFILLS